ncbi:hypothetical protein [Streptomyces sp. NPDC057781]|uniref:hypothetical protein n=1 Tax=unclassified Streptomyces TaxID=2593676 RepID=UPI0036750F30
MTRSLQAVAARPERTLVRAHLVLLGKVLARGAATDALDELADTAQQLTPTLRTRAVLTLEAAPLTPGPMAHEEVLPPRPDPVRLAPAPESPAELAEEISALPASGGDVPAFERALDGLVRHTSRDRDALLQALEPVIARRWWADSERLYGSLSEDYFDGNHDLFDTGRALDLLLATLRGKVRTTPLQRALRQQDSDRGCVHSSLACPFEARLWEVAHRLRADPQPFLLAAPAWGTGLLEPGEPVDRLDAYRRLRARVSVVVFGHALLQVRRGHRAAAAAATEANATIWGVLRQVLPVLLAVAADCAERVGARGGLPHLSDAADRRGSSRLVAQARRLRGALAEEAAAEVAAA